MAPPTHGRYLVPGWCSCVSGPFVHGVLGLFGGGVATMATFTSNASFGVNIIEVFSNQFRVVLIDFFLVTSNAGTWLLRLGGIYLYKNHNEKNIKYRNPISAIKSAFIN